MQWARAPLFIPRKNIVRKQKLQKHNINKIYQREPRLGEMTCLMTIAETNMIFSAFQFFDKHYWNNDLGKLIAAAQASTLKRSESWKSLTSLCALQKNNSRWTKAVTGRCF